MLVKYIFAILLVVSTHSWGSASHQIRQDVEPGSDLSFSLLYPELTQRVYQETSYPVVWASPAASSAFEFQLSLIDKAQFAPLFSEQFKQIEQYKASGEWDKVDILTTDALLHYLSYVENAPLIGKEWYFSEKLQDRLPEPAPETIERLRDSIDNGYLLELVLSYAPPVGNFDQFKESYAVLSQAMDETVPLYDQIGLKRFEDEITQKPILLERMALVGVDISHVDPNIPIFDLELEIAVKSFQKIHGIKSDGIIGPDTMTWINMPFDDRLRAIALNAERARLWPKDKDSLIVVNVPSFEMKYWEGGKEVFESKVVVGRKSRKTPLLEINLDSVILNPTWNVPWKIMVKDILPKVREDESYLTSNNFRVIDGWRTMETIDPELIDWQSINFNSFPYRMRQEAGSRNALGLYKFNTPNNRAIYLHDTPSKGLFNDDFRAYSSGCIRVEHAEELAELLFATKVRKAPQQDGSLGPNTKVRLKKRIPVHIIYQTVLFEEEGIQYRGDVYQYDKEGGEG